MKKQNKHEEKLLLFLMQLFPEQIPEREFRFHPVRKWRFDFAYPVLKIALEVEGGIWTGGRHVNPLGYSKDAEKYNMATKMGWKVYRLVPGMINLEYIEELLIA